MQLFIDSADVAELRAAAASGLIDGVTTNPSLIAKSGRKMKEAIAEICAIIPGPVSAEAVATDVEGMLAEGRYLARIASNVVVKLPLTENGLRVDKCRRGPRDVLLPCHLLGAQSRFVATSKDRD